MMDARPRERERQRQRAREGQGQGRGGRGEGGPLQVRMPIEEIQGDTEVEMGEVARERGGRGREGREGEGRREGREGRVGRERERGALNNNQNDNNVPNANLNPDARPRNDLPNEHDRFLVPQRGRFWPS